MREEVREVRRWRGGEEVVREEGGEGKEST